MTLSKKDYEAAAAQLRPLLSDNRVDRYTYDRIVSTLSDMYWRDNPQFNRRKFAEACGATLDLGDK